MYTSCQIFKYIIWRSVNLLFTEWRASCLWCRRNKSNIWHTEVCVLTNTTVYVLTSKTVYVLTSTQHRSLSRYYSKYQVVATNLTRFIQYASVSETYFFLLGIRNILTSHDNIWRPRLPCLICNVRLPEACPFLWDQSDMVTQNWVLICVVLGYAKQI